MRARGIKTRERFRGRQLGQGAEAGKGDMREKRRRGTERREMVRWYSASITVSGATSGRWEQVQFGDALGPRTNKGREREYHSKPHQVPEIIEGKERGF